MQVIKKAYSPFEYILKKINSASFSYDPFKHITISQFFKPEHFDLIVQDPQIKCKKFSDNKDLVDGLIGLGYAPQPFPGCVTNIDQYLRYLKNPSRNFSPSHIEGYGKEVIEGYGMTMRMKEIRPEFLVELNSFLNSDQFLTSLKSKFEVSEEVYVETT